jgi:dTDP-4-amino-4,6-dideoxygalactose transaminase
VIVVDPNAVPFLDLAAQHDEIRTELDGAWLEVSAANAFVGGDHVARFESEFAQYSGVSHCVGVANGTDALSLIIAALGIGAGDEVILPANTFVATAEAIVAAGATPVFADVDPDTLLLTAYDVAEAITPRTAGVIAVHLYGQVPDMDAIGEVTSRAGVVLLEDAAQAHGAQWRERRAGSLSRAAAFSFYPGKNLGAFGDAGGITTNDADLSRRVRTLADHGRAIGGRYQHDIVGCNSRLDALHAAILSIKLRELDRWNALRQQADRWYRAMLGSTNCHTLGTDPRATSVHHLEVVRVNERERLLQAFAARGIGFGLHYPVPVHRQRAFARYATRPLPIVERTAEEIVSLPMFPTITRRQVEYVCEAILSVTEEREYGYAG